MVHFSEYSLRFFLTAFIIALCSFFARSQSGKAFRDFNNNGIADTTDIGIAGISVQSFKASGALLGSAITNKQGIYSLTPSAAPGESVRVEFVIPDSLNVFFPSASARGAANKGTSVQFVEGPATNVNFGINRAIDFCEAGPPVSIVCFIIGSGTTIGDNLLATVPYSSTGVDGSVVGHPAATGATVGAVWGTSYQNDTDRLFMASFMRRHTAFGMGGTGAIYVTTSPRTPSQSASYELINLNGLTVNHAAGGMVTIKTGIDPHDKTNYFADIIHDGLNPADSVGKISLGDMDMSSDGQHLFVVNLTDKRLYRIAIDADHNPSTNPVAADVLAYDIPNPGCTGGVARPFGLGVRGDNVFVGVTCDASISRQKSDLRAYVYQLNTITNTFTEAVNISLNYARGTVAGVTFARDKSSWQPWTNDADWNNDNESVGEVFSFSYRPEVLCPQPLLSDIVFDDDGALVLGFMDRFGHQAIYHGPDPNGNISNGQYRKIDPRAAGDVIRICNTGTLTKPVYEAESMGKCGNIGGGQFSDAAYPDAEYEFYTGDNFNDDSHTETAIGSLGLIPGSGELIVAAFNPIQQSNAGSIFSNGFKILSNTTGKAIRGFSLLNDIPEHNGNNQFGKASGLGGVEVLCLPKPLEIGNRVWQDINSNGIQDADEAPIAGVILELYASNNQLVGRDTSDVNGIYSFNSQNIVDTIGIQKPNRPGLQINSDYTIRVATSQYNGRGTGPLTGLTIPSPAAHVRLFADAPIADNQIRDNDASLVDGLIITNVHTGYSGENDHTIDLGFAPIPPCLLSLTANASSQTLTAGQSLTLSAQIASTGSYSYTWAGPANVLITPTNSATATTSALPTGNYTFTVTATSTTQADCFSAVTVSVEVIPVPVPALHLLKLVNTSKAKIGDVITYTIVLTNTGNGPATNVQVSDSLSSNLAFITGSSSPSNGNFTPGVRKHTWAISSLPVNGTATLVYSASITGEGFAYNTATIPGDTARVCTPVPYIVCQNSGYAIPIIGPAGRTNYKFFQNNILVYEGPSNIFTAISPGEYRVETSDNQDICSQARCCSVIIDEIKAKCMSIIANRIN